MAGFISGLAPQGDAQPDPLQQFLPKHTREQLSSFSAEGVQHSLDNLTGVPLRVAEKMGPDKFMHAWAVRTAVDSGVRYDDLAPADQQVWDEFGQNMVHEAKINFEVGQYASDLANAGFFRRAIRPMGLFVDGVLSVLPKMVWGAASLLSKKAPAAMNAAIGASGNDISVGFYSGALANKVAGSLGPGTPLSDYYRVIAEGEQLYRTGQQDPANRIQDLIGTVAGSVGELTGIIGKGITGANLLGRGFTAAEKALRIEKIAANASKWVAERAGSLAPMLSRMAGEGILAGSRFGAYEGIANYVNPDGTMKDGGERLLDGLKTAALMPIFTGILYGASRAGSWVRGDGRALSGAMGEYLGTLDRRAVHGLMGEGGQIDPSKLALRFAADGMPTLRPASLARRIAGTGTQLALESLGFSATDHHFWGDLIDATLHGDKKALGSALETMLTNGLFVSLLRLGSSEEIAKVRAHENAQKDLAEIAPPEQPMAPAEPAASAEPQPAVPTPAEMRAPQPQRDPIADAEFWLERQPDPRLEAEVLARKATTAAEGLQGPLKSFYETYATRLRNWVDRGAEGPRPKFPGDVPAEVKAWEQDLLDRRSRAVSQRTETGRETIIKASRSAAEALAEGKAQVRTARERQAADYRGETRKLADEAAKQAADELAIETARNDRLRQLAESRMALDGLGARVDEGIHLVVPRGSKPLLLRWVADTPRTTTPGHETITASDKPPKVASGHFETKPLYGAEDWKPIAVKQAQSFRTAPAMTEPIPDQMALVDQLARRALEVGKEIGVSPSQELALAAAIRVAATMPRGKDRAVDAALRMVEQMPPETWGKRHLEVWAQMALRGLSPQTQQMLLDALAKEPPVQPTPGQPEVPGQAQAAPEQPTRQVADNQPSASASAKPATAPETAATTEPAATQNTAEKTPEGPLAEIPAEFRDVAKPSREEGGFAHAGDLAGAALLGGMYLLGAPASLVMGIGAAAVFGKSIVNGFARNLFEGVRVQSGPKPKPEVGKALDIYEEAVRKAVDDAANIRGRLTDDAMELLRLTGEADFDYRDASGLDLAAIGGGYFAGSTLGSLGAAGGAIAGVGAARMRLERKPSATKARKNRAATQALQKVTWTGDDKNAIGFSNTLEYVENRLDRSKLPRIERDIVERIAEFSKKMGDEFGAVGAHIQKRSTGESMRVGFRGSPDKMARVFNEDGFYIMTHPDSDGFRVLTELMAKKTGRDLPALRKQYRAFGQMVAERRAPQEFMREIDLMPDYIRINGHDIPMLESRPYEWTKAMFHRIPARIAAIANFGQRLPFEGEIPSTITPQVRKTLDAIATIHANAPDQSAMERTLIAAMRALHDTAIDRPILKPGSVGYELWRDVGMPLRAVWTAAKLSKAFLVNAVEVYGTPATHLGHMEIGKAHFETMRQLFFDLPRLIRDAEALQKEGLVDVMPPRFGALSRERRTAHRAYDIAEQLGKIAAPQELMNWANDITVARAGKNILERWKATGARVGAAEMADRRETANFFEIRGEMQDQLVSGKASPELEARFLRMLRRDSMGAGRARVERSLWQSLRAVRASLPIIGYASHNLRTWTRSVERLAESWRKGPDGKYLISDPVQRAAIRRRFFKFALSKGAVIAPLATGLILAWNYAGNLVDAFAGQDAEDTATNVGREILKSFLANELGGPALGTIYRSVSRPQDGDMLQQALASTWWSDMWRTTVKAWNTEGVFLNRTSPIGNTPARFNLPSKLWTLIESQIPLLQDANRWTEDPELALALRRFYEVHPIESGASNSEVKYTEFRSAMRNFRTALRAAGAHPTAHEADNLVSILKRAITTEGGGWDKVAASLSGMRVLRGLKPEETEALQHRLGPLYQRLVEHDAALERFASWARR